MKDPMTTHRKPLSGFRKSTAKDACWGKTIYLICNQTTRSITLHKMTIDKLGLKEVAPKGGMNAADHDRYLAEVNAERLRQMKVIAGEGKYLVEIEKEMI
jgi:hypothetical protein